MFQNFRNSVKAAAARFKAQFAPVAAPIAVTQHADPVMAVEPKQRTPGAFGGGHKPAGSKLAKRFSEANVRSPRGY